MTTTGFAPTSRVRNKSKRIKELIDTGLPTNQERLAYVRDQFMQQQFAEIATRKLNPKLVLRQHPLVLNVIEDDIPPFLPTAHGCTHLFVYGNWVFRFILHRQMWREYNDFDIALWVGGGGPLFHPAAIEQLIVDECGADVYRQYVSMVMSQFDEAMDTILPALFNLGLPDVGSVTCCARSEKLLRQRPEFVLKKGCAFLLNPNQ